MSRYRFVEAESSRYPVTRLCRMAQVSRAAYYEWQDGRGSARQAADAALTAAIRAIHAASRGQYGVPRVLAELRAQGHDVGRKRVARLMAAGRAAEAASAALGAHDDAGAHAAGDPGSGARRVHR
jgi:transposase InsO family protein